MEGSFFPFTEGFTILKDFIIYFTSLAKSPFIYYTVIY